MLTHWGYCSLALSHGYDDSQQNMDENVATFIVIIVAADGLALLGGRTPPDTEMTNAGSLISMG